MWPYHSLIKFVSYFSISVVQIVVSPCVVVVVVEEVVEVAERAFLSFLRRVVSFPKSSQKRVQSNFAYQEHLQTAPSRGARGHTVKPQSGTQLKDEMHTTASVEIIEENRSQECRNPQM